MTPLVPKVPYPGLGFSTNNCTWVKYKYFCIPPSTRKSTSSNCQIQIHVQAQVFYLKYKYKLKYFSRSQKHVVLPVIVPSTIYMYLYVINLENKYGK